MATGRMEHTGAAPATTLASSMSAVDTAFTTALGSGYPTGAVGNFLICVDPGLPSEEHILCSARAGVTFTVAGGVAGRGYDNTTAQAHTAPTAVVEHIAGAFELDDYNSHIYDTTRRDHTQYALLSGATFTGGVTVSAGGLIVSSGGMGVTGAATFSSTVSAAGGVNANFTGSQGRFVGMTVGAPISGTYLSNDWAVDSTNTVVWVCSSGGTPGTWLPAGSPSHFAAEATRTTIQSIVHDTWTIIQFDSENDPGSNFTPGAGAKYTCPLAGRYLTTVTTGFASLANGTGAAVYRNGALVTQTNTSGITDGSGNSVTTATARLRCAASDTLQGAAFVANVTTNLAANKGTMSVDYLGP